VYYPRQLAVRCDLQSSQPVDPLSGARFLSLLAAETLSGLACLIQQAKKLFHSWLLGIYQEVLTQKFSGGFGLAPLEVWENLKPLVRIKWETVD
jgi:hypothetical protein